MARAVTDPLPEPDSFRRSASIEPPPPSSAAPRPLSIPPPEPRPAKPTLYARVLPDVVAGLISSTLILSFGISLAALIFAGDLARHLPAGIGVILVSTAVIAALV